MSARAVWSVSAGLAAEVEGLRVESLEDAAALVRSRLDDGADVLTVPFEAADGSGTLELARRGAPFELAERSSPRSRPSWPASPPASPATRRGCRRGRRWTSSATRWPLSPQTRARQRGSPGSRRSQRAATQRSSGGSGTTCSRRPARMGRSWPTPRSSALRTTWSRGTAGLRVDGDPSAPVVTVQLGRPVLGALQVRFASGRSLDGRVREQLTGFAVRAAHALRSSERAREAGLELERSRALLAVVGEAIAQLSLSHTLETAIERVAHLLGVDRVAVYLSEEGRMAVAAARGIDGPHEAVADALLAPRSGHGREAAVVEVSDARTHEALEPVRALVEEAGIRSALALGARRRRRADRRARRVSAAPASAEPERARAPDGARGPARRGGAERAPARARHHALRRARSGARLRAGEVEAAARAVRDLARRSRRASRSATTLDELAEAIVELLGVDAAVDPDARRARRGARRSRGARQRRAGRFRGCAPCSRARSSCRAGSSSPCSSAASR